MRLSTDTFNVNYFIFPEKIKTRANIAIDPSQGRNMLGVLDETGTLNEGQVFVQYTKDISCGETTRDTVILESRCHFNLLHMLLSLPLFSSKKIAFNKIATLSTSNRTFIHGAFIQNSFLSLSLPFLSKMECGSKNRIFPNLCWYFLLKSAF